MVGTTLRVPYSAFYANVAEALEPVVAYVIKLPIPKYSKKRPVSYCVVIRPHGKERNTMPLNEVFLVWSPKYR